MLHPFQSAELAREHRAAVRIGRLAATAGSLGRPAHTRVAHVVVGSASSRGQ